jgi:lysophospholipase L1-like esterase
MTVRLAVLGDSIAAGQGARRPQDRPADRLVRALAERGTPVVPTSVAVPGARSADLAGQVDRVLGEPPDVALIVIGANDLTHRVPALQAAADLEGAVARLRRAGAEVVVAPAPDLSAVPHVPPELAPVVRAVSNQLRELQAAAVRRHGARVADEDHATSASFADDPSLFSADRFHPSSEGYAVIARALLPVVAAAVDAALPSAS